MVCYGKLLAAEIPVRSDHVRAVIGGELALEKFCAANTEFRFLDPADLDQSGEQISC